MPFCVLYFGFLLCHSSCVSLFSQRSVWHYGTKRRGQLLCWKVWQQGQFWGAGPHVQHPPCGYHHSQIRRGIVGPGKTQTCIPWLTHFSVKWPYLLLQRHLLALNHALSVYAVWDFCAFACKYKKQAEFYVDARIMVVLCSCGECLALRWYKPMFTQDRATFRRLIVKNNAKKRRMYETFIESVPLLKSLEVCECIFIEQCKMTNLSITAIDLPKDFYWQRTKWQIVW